MTGYFSKLAVLALALAVFLPDLHAQDAVFVFSMTTVSNGNVVGECGTEMEGNVGFYYDGVDAVCTTSMNGTPLTNQPFGNGGISYAVAIAFHDFPLVPGATYETDGTHDLFFSIDDFFGYDDPLDFIDVTPVPANECGSGCEVTAGADFGLWGYYELCCDPELTVAFTASQLTTVDVTPSLTSLGPTQKEQFEANIPVQWSVVSGGDNVNPNTGLYTAPSTIPNEATSTIQACDIQNSGNCGTANVSLVPIDVFVSPVSADVIPGTTQKYDASTNFTDLPDTMNWSLSGPGTISSSASNSVIYTAPPPAQVTSSVTATITACSTVDTSGKRCGTATANVAPVTITVNALQNPFLASAGATLQMTDSVLGTTNNAVTWSIVQTNPPSPGTIDPNTGIYTAPLSPVIPVQQAIQIKACLVANINICSAPFTLTLVPPVVITTVTGALNAGESDPIVVTGTGFGANPLISFNDPALIVSPTQSTSPNTIARANVAAPVLTPFETITLTVTDTTSGLFIPPSATFSVQVKPAVLAVQVTPPNATLQTTQSQQFTPLVTCRTASGFTCILPSGTTCSLNSPALGTLDPVTCVYTATDLVTSQTVVTGKACLVVNPLVCGPFTVTLVPTPLGALSTANLAFLPQTLGTSSSPQSVTLTNSGTASLTISRVATGSKDFSVLVNTCGTSLAAGANCSISVVFSPTALGTRTDTLTITDNDPRGPQKAGLNGVGKQITIVPNPVTFAAQVVGTSSSPQTITLTNNTPVAVSINNISPTSDFSIRNNTCTGSIAAAASCTMDVIFAPIAVGPRSAQILVSDSDSSSPQSVALNGSGLPLIPVLSAITPATVTMNSSSFTVVATGSSFGNGALIRVNGTAIPTTFFPGFAQAGLPPQLRGTVSAGSLGSAGQINVTVLNPGTSGGESAALPLTITTSAIPLISSLSPAKIVAGGSSLTLEINGSNFPPDSQVQVNGSYRATTFVSANQLTVTILSSDIAQSGFPLITVLSPSEGNSNTAPLVVFRYGDVNFDNSLTISDLITIANIIAGNIVPLDTAPADLNCDGMITIQDQVTLANVLAGNITQLPVGTGCPR